MFDKKRLDENAECMYIQGKKALGGAWNFTCVLPLQGSLLSVRQRLRFFSSARECDPKQLGGFFARIPSSFIKNA